MNFLEELFKKQVIPFLLTGSSLVIFILFHQLILFLNLVCQIFDNYKVVVVKKKKNCYRFRRRRSHERREFQQKQHQKISTTQENPLSHFPIKLLIKKGLEYFCSTNQNQELLPYIIWKTIWTAIIHTRTKMSGSSRQNRPTKVDINIGKRHAKIQEMQRMWHPPRQSD